MRIFSSTTSRSTSSSRIAMIPSPLPMSLLAKSSNEKLNELMAEDCQELPLTLLNRLYQSTKCWLMVATEQHRKKLSIQVKKNWLRLVISISVVIVQFLWFASYYIGLNTAETYSNLLSIQTNQPAIVEKDNVQSSLIYSMPPYPLVDAVIINMSSTSDNSKEINSLDTNKQQQQYEEAKNWNCELPFSKSLVPQEPWPSFLWRIFLGIKLALMMIGLELVRLFDTVWEIFRKQKSQDDDKNRKSFIDLSYIERNRGYK